MHNEDEYRQLEAENKRIKQLLKENGIFYLEDGEELSSNEKIEIFKSYFRGNDNVFACRFWNKNQNKYGWAPSCKNNLKECCPHKHRMKQKCIECQYFERESLTTEVLSKHLKDAEFLGIGLYPLQNNSTCYFMAIDFDEDDWFEAMLCVYRIARELELECVMEKSASGQGGHLWFFFSTAIHAYKARKLANRLLEKAMNRNKNISFKSFDRIFPNQDYVSEKGLGNLIAAPFWKHALLSKQRSTCFIDTDGKFIKHPMEYLAQIRKITQEEIEVLTQYEEDYFFENDQLSLSLDTDFKYSWKIECIEESMLRISKHGLNAATLSLLKRSASIINPDYKNKVQMKLPIYNTPRIKCWYEETDQYLYIPRGRFEFLKERMPGTQWIYENHCIQGKEIEVAFKGNIRVDQSSAITKLMKYDLGILKAEPGWGKTIATIYLIAQLKVSTLIIVNRVVLQKQWVNQIKEFLQYEGCDKKKNTYIGRIDGNNKKVFGNIDVAVDKSLASMENIDEILSNYGMVVVDECHNIGSTTYDLILKRVKAKRVYGLSATPDKQKGLFPVVQMYCGPVRVSENKKSVSAMHKILIPRYTNTRILEKDYNPTELLQYLCENQARNYMIFQDVLKEYRENSQCIVLSERIEHLETLKQMLEQSVENVFIIHGKTKIKDRNETLQKLKDLSGKPFVLLAISKGIGEGFDLPALRTLFITAPFSADYRVIQYTGRIEREFENKDTIKVYDYVDSEIRMAKSMYEKRLKVYLSNGYYIQNETNDIDAEKMLFDYESFQKQVVDDMKNAKKEITFFSTTNDFESFYQFYDLLSKLHWNGIQIHFVVNDKTNPQIVKYMTGLGGNVIYSEHAMHLIVIDKEIVWNCPSDLFESGNFEDGYLRYESIQLASEALSSVNDKDEINEGLFAL